MKNENLKLQVIIFCFGNNLVIFNTGNTVLSTRWRVSNLGRRTFQNTRFVNSAKKKLDVI